MTVRHACMWLVAACTSCLGAAPAWAQAVAAPEKAKPVQGDPGHLVDARC